VPPVREDRVLSKDIEKIKQIIVEGTLLKEVFQ
jgi:histidine ammonia-lyase